VDATYDGAPLRELPHLSLRVSQPDPGDATRGSPRCMLVSRHPPSPRGGAHRGFPRWAGEREGGHWTVGPEVSGRQMAAGCRSTLPPSASLSRGTRREREARRGARAGVRRPRPHSSDPRPSPQFNHGPRSSLAFASHQQCCAEPEVPHRAKPVIALGHSALRPRDGVPSGPSLAGAAWAGDRGARRPGVARLDATELRGTGAVAELGGARSYARRLRDYEGRDQVSGSSSGSGQTPPRGRPRSQPCSR
jgi:hypothetical protein